MYATNMLQIVFYSKWTNTVLFYYLSKKVYFYKLYALFCAFKSAIEQVL